MYKHLKINAERAIQNNIKDSLVLASTERILAKITKSSYMDPITNQIVDCEETTFEKKLVNKLSKKVIPNIITESTAELRRNIKRVATVNLTNQEHINNELNEKFWEMKLESNDTSILLDKVAQKQQMLKESLRDQRSKAENFKGDESDIKAEIKQ